MSKNTHKFSVAFIDADETLLDFSKSERVALRATLTQSGYPWNEEINEIYLRENLKIWKAYEKGEITRKRLQYARFERFFACVGFGKDADCQEINDSYISNLSQCGYIIKGADKLCKTLFDNGIKLFVTTNGLKKAQHGRFEKSGLLAYIQKLYISEEMDTQKPNKDYFDYIFKEQNITDKNSVIILGDSLTSDMQGGKNAGITTCLFDPKGEEQGCNNLYDFKIKDLVDFANIVL